jgi:hypothetical protein
MATDLGQLGDMPDLEQLDQMSTRNIEEISRFLSRHGFVVLYDSHLFACEEQFRGPLDDARQRDNQVAHVFCGGLYSRFTMHDRDHSSRRFLACTVQRRRSFGTRLCCSSWTHGEFPFVSRVSIIVIYSKPSRTIPGDLGGSLPKGNRRSKVRYFSAFIDRNWSICEGVQHIHFTCCGARSEFSVSNHVKTNLCR